MSGPPIVLKLGGAQAHGPWLRAWLDAIAACAGRIVVVSGGGPFADAVRAEQKVIGFDDAAAHDMAMVAMQQFGRALVSLRPGFVTAETEIAIFDALAQALVPIWAPRRMALAAELPPSWNTTSDSLSAWLAGRLGASRLILVKHGEAAPAATLAARGVVDSNFPAYLGGARVRAYLAAPERPDLLREAMDGEALPFIGGGADFIPS